MSELSGAGGISGASTYTARMEEHAAECIIEQHLEARATVASVVQSFPQAYGAEAAFALTAVAVGLERPILRTRAEFQPQRVGLYRCIALLAADIYAVEHKNRWRCTCGDISRYWQATNEIFFAFERAPDGRTAAPRDQL